MKFQKTSILLGLMILLAACSGQEIDLTLAITPTSTSSPTLKPTTAIPPTITSSPTLKPTTAIQSTRTPIPTQAVTPTYDICSKLTIPSDVLPAQPDSNTNRLIAITSGSQNNGDEVFIMDMDGQNRKDITNHPASDVSPLWSPDGKHIAFRSNRNGRITVTCYGAGDDCIYELFVVEPDGTGLRQITKGWTFSPAWSPDGKQIAFVRSFKSDASPNPSDPFLYDIYIVNSDGTNLRNLTNSPGYYYQPRWSPDGKKIAFLSKEASYLGTINIINSDGTGLLIYSDLKASLLVWTLDNNYLIFVAKQENSPGSDLYKLKTDLTSIEQLTFTPNAEKDWITLSPDGRWLAYHSQFYTSQFLNLCDQIRVLDIETLQDFFVYDARDVEKITVEANRVPPSNSPLSIYDITWTPDNRQLIFIQWVVYEAVFGEFMQPFIIQLDGRGLKQLGEGGASSLSVQP
jgi:Tol biopolymer transport system component